MQQQTLAHLVHERMNNMRELIGKVVEACRLNVETNQAQNDALRTINETIRTTNKTVDLLMERIEALEKRVDAARKCH